MSLAALCWPIERLGEALVVLARHTGLAADTSAPLVPPSGLDDAPGQCDRWVQWAGGRIGLEAESVSTTLADCRGMLLKAAPALVQVQIQGRQGFLVLLAARRGRLRLVAPDLRVRSMPVDQVRQALCAPIEAPLLPEINHVLGLAGMPEARRDDARRAMLLERLGHQMLSGFWLLRPRADNAFLRQLQHAGLGTRLVQMLALFALVYALEIGGWGLMGEGVLQGRLDHGWLLAWCLLLLTLVPIRLLASRLDIDFGLGAARVLKRRLLAGALKMDPDAVRHLGVGQLLGRVLESQSFEAQVVGGVLGVVMASVELLMAAWVLTIGAGSQLHLVLLAGWLAVTLLLTHRFVRRMRSWTAMRLDMTHDLVERMVGHRTRLAQEQPKRRDAHDDAVLQDYLKTSAAMDAAIARVSALIPGGWLLLGLLGLVPAFMAGGVSSAAMAIGFGGVLFANRAFTGLSAALTSLAGAGLSWEQVGPYFKAAAQPVAPEPFLPAFHGEAMGDERIVDAQQLVFRYRAQGAPVIDGLDLSIRRGEKILLQGPSGGGKSTLVALLTGLRQPESGLLLLQGLDRHTLGDAWHGLATEAPQFHENHILSGTLGFNLLMGRGWPASEADLAEARQLCFELGLGELLERMPAGLMQTVGETGWQLSHGERSRIFLARALLQNAPLTVMDESFAALDPRTLRQCLDCVLRRAQTLVVVAHP